MKQDIVNARYFLIAYAELLGQAQEAARRSDFPNASALRRSAKKALQQAEAIINGDGESLPENHPEALANLLAKIQSKQPK